MLLREEHRQLVEADSDFILGLHLKRALKVRLHFEPIMDAVYGGAAWAPGCHEFAHAFGRVFDLCAVDGVHTFIKDTQIHRSRLRGEDICRVTASDYLHSWIELEVGDGQIAILDLYPDEGGSALPALLAAPHPTYRISTDPRVVRELEKTKTSAFAERVQLVEKEIRRIADEHDLWGR